MINETVGSSIPPASIERKVSCIPETKRKQKESFEALVRRFNKQVQQSGRTLQVKKIRFYARPKNKRKLKETAMRRIMIETKKEYLKKVGKLKDGFPGTKAIMKL